MASLLHINLHRQERHRRSPLSSKNEECGCTVFLFLFLFLFFFFFNDILLRTHTITTNTGLEIPVLHFARKSPLCRTATPAVFSLATLPGGAV